MKKNVISLFIITLFISSQLFSQEEGSELVNKKGKPILPSSGNFALGIGANSIINFAGNVFNNTQFNNLFFQRFQLAVNLDGV